MKLWNVFFDTSIFHSFNLNIDSKLFSIIQSLCESERVNLIITDITIGEIKATKIHPKGIFSDYFEDRSPFGGGKKKNEFPDAFIIAAIDEWVKKTGNKIYVVGRDQDFKDVQTINNNLICLKSFERIYRIGFI